MKTHHKILSLVMAVLLSGAMCACGSDTDNTSSNETESSVSDGAAASKAKSSSSKTASVASDVVDPTNPVLRYSGTYMADKYEINIQGSGKTDAAVTVKLTTGKNTYTMWEMSGVFYDDKATISYNNCTKTDVKMNDNGIVESEEKKYDKGSGTITFDSDGSVKWSDIQEKSAESLKFTYYDNAEM